MHSKIPQEGTTSVLLEGCKWGTLASREEPLAT
jgi:hypothetical protein